MKNLITWSKCYYLDFSIIKKKEKSHTEKDKYRMILRISGIKKKQTSNKQMDKQRAEKKKKRAESDL